MDRLPNEIRVMILRLLPDKRDKKALAAAIPSWEGVFKLEESLRVVTIDPAGILGMTVEQFEAMYEGTKIRRRQFLEEVRLKFFLNSYGQPERCCIASCWLDWDSDEFSDGVEAVLEALHSVGERAAEAGIKPPPIRIEFTTCTNGLETRRQCSGSCWDRQVQAELVCPHDGYLWLYHRDLTFSKLKGVDEVYFRNHGLFRYLDEAAMFIFIQMLPDLRVFRFEFKEELLWPEEKKKDWRNRIVQQASWVREETSPLEEIYLHLGRHSPRNEVARTYRQWWERESDEAAYLFRNLSHHQSLAVLHLSGQFFLLSSSFDLLAAEENPFPALKRFHLGFGPDTADRDWFFVKNETEHAWTKAAKDPEWTVCVELTKKGVLPQDPPPDRSVWDHDDSDSESEGYESPDEYAFLDPDPVKRNRTLPNDATINPLLLGAARAVAKMPCLEEFSLCLEDKFDEDDCEHPFVPPFLTRVFAVRFLRKPDGRARPSVTFKLGHKVDYWRPADDVLQAWKSAGGGLRPNISFIEYSGAGRGSL